MRTNIIFKTDNLILRGLRQFDNKTLYNAIKQSDEHIQPWLYWPKDEFDMEKSDDWIKSSRESWVLNTYYEFGIFHRKSGELAGCVYLSSLDLNANMANVGYWVFGKYQRRGYALEAAKKIIAHAFHDMQLTRLEIVTTPDNIPSRNLAEKLGATFECKARNRFVYNGMIKDGFVFSLIPSDIE